MIGGEALVVASLEYEYRFRSQVGRRGLLRHGQRLPRLQRPLSGAGRRRRHPLALADRPRPRGRRLRSLRPGHPIVFHLNIGPDL